jgi:hypothetical protein
MTHATDDKQFNVLELLELRLAMVDLGREQAMQEHPDPASVDRTASVSALRILKEHLNSCAIESSAIDRLLVQLAALHAGGKPAPMFAPAAISNRAPDHDAVQMLKGSLGAIMQLKQDEHVSRMDAAKWVINGVSGDLLRRISPKPQSVTWQTVAGWRDKYNAGPRTPGRANYDWILKRGRQAKENGRGDSAEGLLTIIEHHFISLLPVLE